jgi:hypothetical protein
VAILGGITNPWGVVCAGLIYGVVEAMIGASLGSTYTQIVAFSLVILALALRPEGLFGRASVKKVGACGFSWPPPRSSLRWSLRHSSQMAISYSSSLSSD